MHFDDRLDTVLKQPVRGHEIARVQYVQLLDLLGKAQAGSSGENLDPAYARLSALAQDLSAAERAQLLGGSGLRLCSPPLVAFLAEDDPAVASAAIAAAQLDEREWLDLVPALPVGARGILRHRRDLGPVVDARLDRLGVADRGLPPGPRDERTVTPLPAALTKVAQQGESSIGELVRRIENFRKNRSAAPAGPTTDAPRLPLGDPDHLPVAPAQCFDFVTDASGRIVRADSDIAPMVVGNLLGGLAVRRTVGAASLPADAIRLRQPIEGQVLAFEGASAIGGDWRIDAAPIFDAATGRYTGHAGRARRLSEEASGANGSPAMADRMRQVLHELRNPAGAIQMASEFIQQQIGGPVAHEYRAIAATIASDTATVLGGLDELDRLVKFDAGAAAMEPGDCDLAACVKETASLLERHMAQRESGFVPDLPDAALPVAIARGDLERLIWRLLAAMAGAVAPTERLALSVSANQAMARTDIALPSALRSLSDDELFAAQANDRGPALSAGLFGLGFTLRLASAEARSAGGSLRRDDERLVLELPASQTPSANVRSG